MITHCTHCRTKLPIGRRNLLCNRCEAGFLDELEARKGEAFALSNAAPDHKPAAFASTKATQRKLLDGLDCLPGQGDLFD